MHDQRALEELARFLVKAKGESYAADEPARVRRLDDGGSEAAHGEGGFRYRDRWYGEARFTGQEVVWREGRPCWTMNFFGATEASAPAEFPHFHKRALRRVPPQAPYRGPALYREGDLVYVNDWSGDLRWFRGVERVFHGEREVYRLEYHGGTLDPT
jgi:hypothetical protein